MTGTGKTSSVPTANQPSVLAVVAGSAEASELAVWHVVLDPDYKTDRLCGAWAFSLATDNSGDTEDAKDAYARLFGLVRRRLVLLVDGTARAAVDQACTEFRTLHQEPNDEASATNIEAELPSQVDLEATVAGIRDHIAELQQQFQEASEKTAAKPRFPKISEVAPIPFEHAGDNREHVVRCLGWARGVEQLVDQWQEAESARRRRKALIEPWGRAPRVLPMLLPA